MIKLLQGDCLELIKDIPDGSIDLVLTDIPYGKVNRKSNGLRNVDIGKADIVTFDLKELTEILCDKTKGSIYMLCCTEQVSAIRATMAAISRGLRKPFLPCVGSLWVLFLVLYLM